MCSPVQAPKWRAGRPACSKGMSIFEREQNPGTEPRSEPRAGDGGPKRRSVPPDSGSRPPPWAAVGLTPPQGRGQGLEPSKVGLKVSEDICSCHEEQE